MFDLSKYAQILAIVWRTVVEIFCLILVYVYKCTCFFLLHHIDIHEHRKLNYSDNLILLDFKKGNSGPYNFFQSLAMTVDVIVFNKVPSINLRNVAVTCFLNHYLMDNWTK